MLSDTWFDTIKLVLLGLIWNSYRHISDLRVPMSCFGTKQKCFREWVKVKKDFFNHYFFCSVMYLTTIFSYLGDWLGEKKLIKTRPVGKSKKEKVSNWWQKNKVSNWWQKNKVSNWLLKLNTDRIWVTAIWIPDY